MHWMMTSRVRGSKTQNTLLILFLFLHKRLLTILIAQQSRKYSDHAIQLITYVSGRDIIERKRGVESNFSQLPIELR